MLFEIYNQLGKRVEFTTTKSCVYKQDILNDMASSGYKFKVDGKWVSKTKVLDAVKASSDTLDPKLEKFIIINPHIEVPEYDPYSEDIVISDTQLSKVSKSNVDVNVTASVNDDSTSPKSNSPTLFSALRQAVETQSNEQKSKRKVRPVHCIENDKVYKNMSEAGRDLGIDPAYISDAVRLNKKCKGYTFEVVND